MSDQTVILLGLIVIFVGLLLAISVLIISALCRGKMSGRGGAVVIVGPLPIVIGSDWRIARQLLVLAIILVAALILFYLIQII